MKYYYTDEEVSKLKEQMVEYNEEVTKTRKFIKFNDTTGDMYAAENITYWLISAFEEPGRWTGYYTTSHLSHVMFQFMLNQD